MLSQYNLYKQAYQSFSKIRLNNLNLDYKILTIFNNFN